MKLDHLSFSQWKAWSACPAAAHAQYVAGAHRPGTTEAMALGTLTESAMTTPGDAAAVIATLEPAAQSLLKTKKGAPTTDAARAVEWGRGAASMPDVQAAMDGAHLQSRLTARLGGVDWVCRLDVWDERHGLVWDIKTVADPLAEEWVERLNRRGNFIAVHRYGYQLALYAEAVAQATEEPPEVGIIAIGKHKTRAGEAVPDVWIYSWGDTDQLAAYRQTLAASCLASWTCDLGAVVPPIPEMYASGGDGLPRCESCDWCIASRVNRVLLYADPEPRARRY